MFTQLRTCNCGSGKIREAQYDGQGIFLTYTCDDCHEEQMKGFNPIILGPYTQADVDEPIEPEE
jgi:hypothetical protein